MNPGLRSLIDKALEQGWVVKRTCGGWAFYSPNDAAIVHTHCTPSDYRAMLNLRSDLKRAGLDLERGK